MNTAFTIRYATELALRVCIFNDIFCYFLHEELPLYFRSVNVKCEFLSMEVGQMYCANQMHLTTFREADILRFYGEK